MVDLPEEDLNATIRELTAQRDKLVPTEIAISAHDLERLHSVLVSELPLEVELSVAAKLRDAKLVDHVAAMPALVEAALVARLHACSKDDLLRRRVAACGKVVQQSSRWPLTFRQLAIAAAVILLAAGTVLVSNWPSPSEGMISREARFNTVSGATSTENNARSPKLLGSGDTFPEASTEHLTLRVSRTELVALQPSLLTAEYLPSRYDAGLPLDLPVRQILMNTESSRIP